jgi:hypothetical protein
MIFVAVLSIGAAILALVSYQQAQIAEEAFRSVEDELRYTNESVHALLMHYEERISALESNTQEVT